MLLESIIKVLEKGIDFAKEGKANKKEFFDEVIQPMHYRFDEFCRLHAATFESVLKMLRDPDFPLAKVAEEVRYREMLERHSWAIFSKFSELQNSETPKELVEYISKIKSVLDYAGYEEFPSIRIYRGIMDEIRYCIDSRGDQETEQTQRERAISLVFSVIEKYNRYKTEVDIAYLKLRKLYKTG